MEITCTKWCNMDGFGPPKWSKMGPKSLSKTLLRSHSISSQIFIDFATIFSSGGYVKMYQKHFLYVFSQFGMGS